MIKNIASRVLLPLTICVLIAVSLKLNTKVDLNLIASNALVNEIKNDNQASLYTNETGNFSLNLGKSYLGFKEALGFKESQGNYFIVNTYGYLGKYQFGKGTLDLIGIKDSKEFLKNPELQEKAFLANAERNKWVLRRDINRFVGKRINGIVITESGILAAAHLAGPGSVKKYLRSYGEDGFSDAFGTSIKYYMKKFSGYDTSSIVANRKAKVSKV